MTQLLTDEEINTIDPDGLREGFARAIEAAVLAKLREQEPFGYFYSDQNGSWRQAHDPQFLHAHVPLYAHPMPPSDVIRDAERLNFITTFGKPWFVQWEKKYDKPVRFRMIDDGDPWGKWHKTAREAIDAAMKESK